MFDEFKHGNEEILTASSSPNDSNCCQPARAEGSVSISVSPIEEKHDGTHPQRALETGVGGKHGNEVATIQCLTGHFLYLMFRCSTHG